MRGFILGLSFLVLSFYTVAQSDIVQGPFKLDDESSIYIKKDSDINYPLGLYFENNGNHYKVDSYEVDGDLPNVETVFLVNIYKQSNVIVLISWKQRHSAEKINGVSYQVYGYKYSSNHLDINTFIKNDQNLTGLDGVFNGEELHFKYKNAAEIKKYLDSHYK